MIRIRPLVALIPIVALTACGGSDSDGSAATTSPATAVQAATSTVYPLTINQCGRDLTFSEAPQTIIVDGEIYAVPLFDLGVGDRITTLFAHNSGRIYPVHGVADDVSAAIKALPEISSESYPSKEALVAADADLIIEAYSGDAAGGDPKGTDALVAEGMNIFSLSPSCPGASLDAYLEDISKLGQILDVNDAATALLDSWRAEIDAAFAKADAAGSGIPKVFFLDSFDDTGAVWSNTGGFLRDLVTAAGGELVPANTTPDDIYTISKESVIAANPDLALTYPTSEDTSTADEEKVAALWDLIPDSPAAKSGTFTLVPYPDGGGTVRLITLIADAIAEFKSTS
jgi:iron complex transport system substrate-binding protein